MGFKDEAREAFANLVTRVEAAEAQLRQLQGQDAAVVRRGTSTPATGVDYAAVAFGLSEIKRRLAPVSHALEGEYVGAVQYFADVFAKADPAFDAESFKRQSGV